MHNTLVNVFPTQQMVCKIQKGYFVIMFINISVKSTDYEGRRKQEEKIKT